MTEIRLEADGTVGGAVLEWRVAVGDHVAAGDALCEVEVDKATLGVVAPMGGTVSEIVAEVGDEVELGGLLAVIDETAA